MATDGNTNARGPRRFALVLAALLGAIGLWLAGGGVWLLWLGGSAYYLLAGLGCLAAAWLYARRRERAAARVYLLVFAGTCAWALAEVGLDFWQLLPRVAGPGFFAAAVVVQRLFASARRSLAWSAAAGSLAALAALVFWLTWLPALPGSGQAGAQKPLAGEDWTAFGRTQSGTRFAPANQITPANVGALEVAWTYHTGDLPAAYPGARSAYTFEATPLKLGDLVYACTPHDIIVAVDADTGKQAWRFDPRINPANLGLLACRGVSHVQLPGRDCASRIVFGTLDARLIALDALTGRPCAGFGSGGTVALTEGLGMSPAGYYAITSPPVIVNGVIVVGGFVLDGQSVGEPSGVIRGYDAVSGAQLWAWDAGARDENWRPGPGEHYTRGSPNSWTVMSADEALGLVYVPLGNATPDYVGMHRTPEDERYSSSVVALDARTGKRRWNFQTVHHDIWDYDVGSQPVLFDLPMPGGATVPALAQPTKQGDIFILDRRTGVPLTPVTERPVARGAIPTERYSPTQPASTGFPSPLAPAPLREADMWGATPLDQLNCRIRFRAADYTGRFTPLSTRPTIQYPSAFGVMDWGSVSIDPTGRTMFVNSSHFVQINRLLPHVHDLPDHSAMFSPQRGTPYAADPQQMISPLGIPCNAPPWGKLTAIDLASRTVKWQRPFGTTHDAAPLGIAVPGAPNIAGSLVTGGGLLFIGAAIDDYLRAFDVRTGHELWRGHLPAGGQAAPMSYVSDRTGRQYVVIAAGGHQLLKTTTGDELVAYALPRKAN